MAAMNLARRRSLGAFAGLVLVVTLGACSEPKRPDGGEGLLPVGAGCASAPRATR
jgi:hypothetical protein